MFFGTRCVGCAITTASERRDTRRTYSPRRIPVLTQIRIDFDERDRAVLVVVTDLAGLGATVPVLDKAPV